MTMHGDSTRGLTSTGADHSKGSELPRFGVVSLTMGQRPDDLRRGLESLLAQFRAGEAVARAADFPKE